MSGCWSCQPDRDNQTALACSQKPTCLLGSWVGKEGIAQVANNCCHQSGLTLPWPWGRVQEHTVMARLSPG